MPVVIVVLQTTARRQLVPFCFSELITIQYVGIDTLLVTLISPGAEQGFGPVAGIGHNGTDALVCALQQKPVLRDEVEFLVVYVHAVMLQRGIEPVGRITGLSPYPIVPYKIQHRAASPHAIGLVIPAVHHVDLLAAGHIHKAVLVHIHLDKLVAGKEHQHRLHLVVLVHLETAGEVQFTLAHRVAIEIDEETFVIGLGFLVVHINLASDGLIAIGDGGHAFGDADRLHPRAGHKAESELVGKQADKGHVLEENLAVDAGQTKH